MRHALLFAAICLSVSPAGAETVRVRSGEHSGFSRLVLGFEKPTEWILAPSADGYTLTMARQDMTFDLTQVFRFIPHDRLQQLDAQPDGGVLTLRLGCDCHAEAFEIEPGKLVLDIKDGPPPQSTVTEADAQEDPVPAASTSASAASGSILARPPVTIIGGFPGPASDLLQESAASGQAAEDHAAAPATSDDTASHEPEPVTEVAGALPADTAELQQMLLLELGRAAAQGLVQADIAPPPAPAAHSTPPRPPARPAPPEQARVPDAPGVLVETSVDRANPSLPRPELTDRGALCLADSVVDLANWGDDRAAATQIAQARGRLVGEFDHVAEENLRAMVRTYLYLGFGAEARALAEAFAAPLSDLAVLTAMADIVDDGVARDPSVFAGQTGCDAQVALWAVLALPDLPVGESVNRAAVVASFSALPLHLRRHLGPGLARRFIDRDDRETASRIRNAVARAGGVADDGLLLTEARMELATGALDAAEPLLEEVAAGGGTLAPEALLSLLEARIAAGRPPDNGDLQDATALAFELRGTPMGAALARAVTLGAALVGDYDTAFARLAQQPRETLAILRKDLYASLTADGDDAMFLKYVYPGTGFEDLPPALGEAMAARLLGLGFADAAEAALPPAASGEAPSLRRLRAGIALARGDSATVLHLLDGDSGPEAERLRAEAQRALGNMTAAERHYAAAGLRDERGSAAWQSGDWETVRALGDAAQRRLAETRLQQAATPPPEPETAGTVPSLKQARALLEQSEVARDLVASLLAADHE